MTDDTRRTTYETAIHRNLWSRGEHGELNGDVVGAVMAVADAELAALEQECRDRECTEQDVRARLADAENALAKVRAITEQGVEALAEVIHCANCIDRQGPDAHMVETLRLRTAALHRVSRSNDLLRRENDDLRARLAQVQARADQCFDLDNSVPVWELRDILDATP